MRSERQALAAIQKLLDEGPVSDDEWLDFEQVRAILADVQPEPAPASGTIDRDAFLAALEKIEDDDRMFDQDDLYQAVLALVRPVEGGVVLTPEEAVMAAEALRWASGRPADASARGALAERLEAAS